VGSRAGWLPNGLEPMLRYDLVQENKRQPQRAQMVPAKYVSPWAYREFPAELAGFVGNWSGR